ncbi:SDR family NAD(P)-dependent oxidoreductase [Streptomyces sp. NPDC049627]|uniref:SDR family NAD(P)-dependent oxidoreductase n=1 Tax=Streptomyces sp. NPDC049627 TaxID=3365595 RepID=UPI0037B828B2
MDRRPTVVVTGAVAPGIGEAVTRRLLKKYRVIGTHGEADKEHAEQLLGAVRELKDCELELFQVDFRERAALEGFVDDLGREVRDKKSHIHGLVNAEYYFMLENPDNFDHDEWAWSVAVNLTAPNFLVRQLSPCLADEGAIVTVTSTEAFAGSYVASAYAASKAAIHNLTKSWANTMPRKIRANAVAAGWIDGALDEVVAKESGEITPLGRPGKPDEVAAAVAFLLSEEASFVNGTVLTVDGGYTGTDAMAKYEYGRTEYP